MSDVPTDPAMPMLHAALDVQQAGAALRQVFGPLDVVNAQLRRHKPGRRCLIEYELDTSSGRISALGKIRARGVDTRTWRVMRACHAAGIPTPEPLGVVPEFQMILQRKVCGSPATTVLPTPRGRAVAQEVADLIARLHAARIPTDRHHSPDDELRILAEQLQRVSEALPHLERRISALLQRCADVAELLPVPAVGTTGIHRDFYADQIHVNAEGVVLLDLDLFCLGDPALDLGNFIAHLIEQGVREYGNPDALRDCSEELVVHYLDQTENGHRAAINIWTRLSLARHVAISARIPERAHLTETMLQLCEYQLG